MDYDDLQYGSNENSISAKTYMRRAGIYFFVIMLLQFPLSFFLIYVRQFFPEKYDTLLSVLITQGYLLISALIFIRICGLTFTGDMHIRKFKLSHFFISVLILIAASPMATVLNAVSQLFVRNEAAQAISEIAGLMPWWMAVMLIGALPGFAEELIYRGIVYTAYRKHSVIAGIVISALCFGLMHGNFNQIPYAVYLGIVFAFLVEATGSLLSSMLLHMLFNAFNTALLYIYPVLIDFLDKNGGEGAAALEESLNAVPTKEQLLSVISFWLPKGLVGIVLIAVFIKAIGFSDGREISLKSISEKQSGDEKLSAVNIWLVLGWILCIIVACLNIL